MEVVSTNVEQNSSNTSKKAMEDMVDNAAVSVAEKPAPRSDNFKKVLITPKFLKVTLLLCAVYVLLINFQILCH